MRSFFHKDFHFQHKYPLKVWSAGIIEDIPYLVSFDGATLRQINLFTKKVTHSIDYHHLNAFSICLYMSTNIYKYENLFLLVKNQRLIEIYDYSLKHITQFDYDTGSAIIAVHWHKPTDRLFTCGTNGWLRCFRITTQHKVTEFVAKWDLLWEIRSTSDWIVSLAHDDFTQILYGAVEDSIFAWDLNTGDFKYRLPQMHNKFKICQVDVDPESSVVITSGQDGYIRTWDIKELECKNLNSFEVAPEGHVSFYMIGRQIVTIGKDRIIKFFGISDSTLRCSVPLADPTQKVNLDEVVNPPLVVLVTEKGSICITSYKEQIQTAVLYSAPEEILSTDSTISSMDFDNKENNLLCLCSNNFIVASHEKGKSTTIDLDVPNTNACKRCCVSEVLCFIVSGDILYAGFKNGSVKCINLRKKECIMLDQVPLDEPIDYITIIHGLFLFNHPTCGEVAPIKTSNNTPFIVCYTCKGNINVWCARCHTHLLTFEIGKKPITCMKLVPEKSLILISAQKTLTIYRINAYDFIPLGEIATSGNQFITSFELTHDMELIAGTSSGEIMILQIEETKDEFHFTVKHHIAFEAGIFKVHFNSIIGKPVICLKNGTLIGMNQKTAKIISRSNNVDAEPLTAVYFKYNENEYKVGAYLAFGSRIHFATVETYEEPVVVKEEEEEEEEQKKEEENDDNEDKAERIIKYYEESQLNISRLLLLSQKEKSKKKRKEYIPEMESSAKPQTQEPVPDKRITTQKSKLTYNEVMAKNRNAIQEALGQFNYSRPSSASKISKKPSYSKFSSENSQSSRSNYDDNQLSLVVTPFFYTDLPENSRVMVPHPKKLSQRSASETETETETDIEEETKSKSSISSQRTKRNNLTVTEKSLVYDERLENGFQAIIDENENVERTTPDYIPPGGRFVLTKLRKEPVKAPTIIKKIFVGPPSSSRILFNDPSTLNGLNFFDPRGFQSRLDAENSESSTALQSSKSTSRNDNNNEEEEEGEKNNEEETNESETQSDNQSEGEKDIIAELTRPKMTDLQKRKLLKKKRVSITQMMTAPSTRSKTSQQVKRKITTGPLNDAPFKAKPILTPKTPTPALKTNFSSLNDQTPSSRRSKVNREPLNTRFQNKNTATTSNSKPPIVITNAHLEPKEKINIDQIQIKPIPQDEAIKNAQTPPPSPKSTSPRTTTSNVTPIKSDKDDTNKEPSKSTVNDESEAKITDNTDSSTEQDKSSAKNENESSDQSENPPQSPKHVQFVIPSNSPKDSKTDINAYEEEIEVEMPIIDIKLRHDMHPQRRRKVKDQPIHLNTPESYLVNYIKNKIPEPEKYVKQKPKAPPRLTPRDEYESIKAQMMSPNLPKKHSSDSSSTASYEKIHNNRKKKKKTNSRSNSSVMSEASSTADSSESNLKELAQDDQNAVVVPEKKPPKQVETLSKDEEQARINQERRKKMLAGGDSIFDSFFHKPNNEKEEVNNEKKESEIKEVKFYYPQLKNLQKFWEQKIISPLLPFDFGDPNTAKYGEGTVFDDSIDKVNPIQGFHLFSGTAKDGVNDLVRRFQKISAFNSGERDNIDDIFEDETKDDILLNLPSHQRRLSF
ncbi:hypothetical protein M9Y10_016397 [Tritrichomonas musculus]|uniref:Uncharacterized protein n=1 Tax=Tritrichomonas musculus TaxID=1915356 RepID=A0ABR2HW27_9EUKA